MTRKQAKTAIPVIIIANLRAALNSLVLSFSGFNSP